MKIPPGYRPLSPYETIRKGDKFIKYNLRFIGSSSLSGWLDTQFCARHKKTPSSGSLSIRHYIRKTKQIKNISPEENLIKEFKTKLNLSKKKNNLVDK